MSGPRTTDIDPEAAALLERNHQRIRMDQARRGEIATHLEPTTDLQQAACGQTSRYQLITVCDPFQVTCRRCLAIFRSGGPLPQGPRK